MYLTVALLSARVRNFLRAINPDFISKVFQQFWSEKPNALNNENTSVSNFGCFDNFVCVMLPLSVVKRILAFSEGSEYFFFKPFKIHTFPMAIVLNRPINTKLVNAHNRTMQNFCQFMCGC